MMNRRILASATLTAALATGGLAGAAFAQDVEPADEDASTKTTTGVITQLPNDDAWYLEVEGALIELSFGPSWYLDLFGLAELFGLPDLEPGDVLEVGGNVRDAMPNENASATAQDKAPILKIKTIGGERRDKGKPPWAGGPKNPELGASHPGYAGWSEGQANRAEAKAANAVKAEARAAKTAARAEVKAAKAAARAEAKPAKPEQSQGRGPKTDD